MTLFGQKSHPLNFDYASRATARPGGIDVTGRTFTTHITCAEITPFCTRLRFDNSNVVDKHNYSDGIIESYRGGKKILPEKASLSFVTTACKVELRASAMKIQMAGGAVLETVGDGFGFNGEKAVFTFNTESATGFFGFGERTRRFNKIGDCLDFYNVDVGSVFPHTFHRDDYDPAYVSIPLAIIRSGGVCTGIYFDNPERLIFDVGQIRPGHLVCESLGSNNDLYIINGPKLRDVVRNFTQITGRADVPPLWSMGYHQCRWGYKNAPDFLALKDRFLEHDLPVSALWYDIDYMDAYRVFTWNKARFPDPAKLNRDLKRAGIRAVTIVDPGVKLEKGYRIYDSGKKTDVFCKTLGGRDYVGRVWPGDTVFPDFSQKRAREWWSRHLAKFMKDSGTVGAWLDMNDPATGWSAVEDMRFGGGAVPHDKYHNQYGHLMAKASRQAFDRMDGSGRPFLLTRSGFTGTQRYSAIWTGDNTSNWEHLRMSIPCTINLGLSGVAFNGPDVGGFFGHSEEELITRWYQAGFLFPFFRNHSSSQTKEQEPWTFGPECLARIRNTIHTRYRLMPYLYNCFFAHHLTGDPILRPLLYEFEGDAYENMDDQFMVGDSLMLAPVLESSTGGKNVIVRGISCQQRHITLPEGWWFDLTEGAWIGGGRTIQRAVSLDEVPLFVRDGAIIPYFNGKVRNAEMDFHRIELHAFIKDRGAQLDYFIDDHKTRKYLSGIFNKAQIHAEVVGSVATFRITETGGHELGTVKFVPVLYGCNAERVAVEYNGSAKAYLLKHSTRRWVAADVDVRVSSPR